MFFVLQPTLGFQFASHNKLLAWECHFAFIPVKIKKGVSINKA